MEQTNEILNQIPKEKLIETPKYPTNLLITALYCPIGIIILTLRLVILSILYILLYFNANLSNNVNFPKILCKIIGIQIELNDNNKILAKFDELIKDKNKRLFIISNHISIFDFLAIKLVFPNVNFINRRELNQFLIIKGSNIYRSLNNARNHPLVYFPEQMRTNGQYGLVKFDFGDLEISENLKFIFIGLRIQSKYALFDQNYWFNCLLCLFLPSLTFNVNLINDELTANTTEELAEKSQKEISLSLGLVPTKYSHKDFLPQPPADPYIQMINRIHEILPQVSHEQIRHYLIESKLTDIDTIVVNLLEKYPPASSSNVPVKSQPTPRQQQQQQSQLKPKIKLTYAERKQILIEEARNRYLMKLNAQK